LLLYLQKTSFLGLSLHEAKRGVSGSFLVDNKSGSSSIARKRLEITARTAGASKTIEAEVDKPLGLTLGQKNGGGVVITVSILLNFPFIQCCHLFIACSTDISFQIEGMSGIQRHRSMSDTTSTHMVTFQYFMFSKYYLRRCVSFVSYV